MLPLVPRAKTNVGHPASSMQVFVHTSGQRPAPVVLVVVDESNVLKWFHDDGYAAVHRRVIASVLTISMVFAAQAPAGERDGR